MDRKRFRCLSAGLEWSYAHFATEVICFYVMSRLTGDSAYLWLAPLFYDALAFVPQGLIGALSDRKPGIKLGVIGLVMMSAACLCGELSLLPGKLTAVTLLCLGNCCVHVDGAEATLRSSGGGLSPSAVFVGGGSFGVITGKLLAKAGVPFPAIILVALSAIPFVLLGEAARQEADRQSSLPCEGFNYHSEKLNPAAVVLIAVMVVAVRGYMGYGIPTSWNKTTFQTVLLYVAMGVGKASGGIFADLFGVRKTAVISAAAALPFLLLGDKHMTVSLIGVLFFSMTMSITLALLTSVLKGAPGVAFGLTTIGLFLGTAPVFFFRLTTLFANGVVIAVLTVLCIIGMLAIIRPDAKGGKYNA